MNGLDKKPAHEAIMLCLDAQIVMLQVAVHSGQAMVHHSVGGIHALIMVMEGMIIPSEHRQGIINGLRVFQRRCGKKQDVAEEIGSLAAKLEAEAEA